MDRGLILYLHGFASSPASHKARLLGETMAARGLQDHWRCPALSPDPTLALAQGEAIVAAARGPVTVVGSSLGGHFATALAEGHDLRAVLINPAVVDCLPIDRFIGTHHNYHTGAPFDFTAEHAATLAQQVVTHPTPARYWLLADEEDEVLATRDAVARYAGCRQTILPGGDHSFPRFAEYLPAILEFAGFPA